MCTAGQRVLLTITGPGPSFFSLSLLLSLTLSLALSLPFSLNFLILLLLKIYVITSGISLSTNSFMRGSSVTMFLNHFFPGKGLFEAPRSLV